MTTVEPIRNKDDIKRVEAVLAGKSKRNLLFFTLGINCGLRISDILALNVGDVKGKDYIRLTEKKTGKFKKFPLNSKLKPMLDEYTEGRSAEEPLFMTRFKNRLDRFSAYRIINSACTEAGINEHVGTHTLRKTFGYHHYNQFRDVAMLQKIFNHFSQDVTLRYIGIEQSEIEASYLKFIL